MFVLCFLCSVSVTIMSSELILGVRLDPQTLTTIKLNDINFKTKVEKLKYETAGRVNLSKDLFGEMFSLFLVSISLVNHNVLSSLTLKQ